MYDVNNELLTVNPDGTSRSIHQAELVIKMAGISVRSSFSDHSFKFNRILRFIYQSVSLAVYNWQFETKLTRFAN